MLVMNDMSFDQRVHREAAALGAAGHDVNVVCLRGSGLPQREERAGYQVTRVADPTTATWRQPFAKMRQSMARTAALAEAAVLAQPQVIHAHDTDTLPAAVRAAEAASAKLVYDAHELFPDQFQGPGDLASRLARVWWRSVEQRLIRRSDAVITVSPGLAEVLASRYGVRAAVLRNVPSLAPRMRSRRLRDELGVPDETPIILYQGLLLPERGLVPLVEAIRYVDGAVLAIQGVGSEEQAMRAAALSAGVGERVRFMGWADPEDALEYASGADIGVVTYEAGTLNNRLSGPNKLFLYLMAGLPVAARDFPGPREVVVGDQVGDVFSEATAEQIAETLNRMLRDRDSLARMAERARSVAESKYNWEREQRVLLAVYERLEHGRAAE